MSRAIVNPLAVAVAAAARLPQTTGATARAQARRERGGMLLVDVSGSMGEMAGARRKVDILGEALAWTLAEMPGMDRVAFAAVPRPLRADEPLPEPAGGTAMHLALRHARSEQAGHVMVISDGAPDDKAVALSEARAIVQSGATISTLYVGRDEDRTAIAFMAELASLGGGRACRHDIVRLGSARLAQTLRLALPAPRR